jgi:hypothetical protein
MEDEQSKKRDKLLQILGEVKRDAHDLTSKGRDIVKIGQFAADLANCTEDYIRCIPEDSFFTSRQWDDQIDSWIKWREGAGYALKVFKIQPIEFANNSTSVATSAAISSVYISFLPQSVQGQARKAYEKYEQLLEQSNVIQELEAEIHRLGMAHAKTGRTSILSHLQQSYQAYKTPSTKEVSPSAVLIPLREAIDLALDELLKRRTQQEGAKGRKDKMISICRQCSRDGVSMSQIDQLANQVGELNDLLSGSKQDAMSRDLIQTS